MSNNNSESNWLLGRAKNVTSQIGQDGILKTIFDIIGPGNRFCVEFGAWDGKYLSNTWNLLTNEGWSGILAEADPDKFLLIAPNHPHGRVKGLNTLISWTGDHAFDQVMEREGAPSRIDLVSIDVDGNDWHIWNSIAVYRPRVVLIEFNPTIQNDVYFVQDADPAVNQGNSLLALVELGTSMGYSLICVDQWDAFFVEDEFLPLFEIADNSVDAMHTSTKLQTSIFQGYDGKLYTCGNRSLIWSGVHFAADEIQLLPKSMQRYRE